jgi:hypothetical protein
MTVIRVPSLCCVCVWASGSYELMGCMCWLVWVQLEANQVTQVKNMLSKKGTVGMQIGAGLKSFKNTPKSMIVHCLKAGVLPKKQIREFGVTLDALLPLGTTITARHFVAGQYVDITGTTYACSTALHCAALLLLLPPFPPITACHVLNTSMGVCVCAQSRQRFSGRYVPLGFRRSARITRCVAHSPLHRFHRLQSGTPLRLVRGRRACVCPVPITIIAVCCV